MRISNHHNRNGITLLFVVSMIVLFLLMGTAFVVLAGDFFRTSRKLAQVEYLKSTNTQALLELGLYEMLRGPDLRAANHPLNGLDLMADMYGYGVRARIKEARFVPNSGNQLIDVRLKSPTGTNGADDTVFRFRNQDERAMTNLPGIYSGQVFSVVSKGDRNESTIATKDESGTSTRIFRHNYDATNGHRFVLPVQYFKNRFTNDTELNEHLTNAVVIINGREFSNMGTPAGNASDVFEFNASHNEPYDAVDDFNPFLYGYPDGNKNNALGSFRLPANTKTVDLDNDGIVDGRWIDLGASPISSPDGKFYKPMFAYKIADFDGKLNLNAHGSPADADTNYWTALNAGRPNVLAPLGGNQPASPPRGMGFGPPEISLRPIFGTNFNSYQSLLSARYGTDVQPGLANQLATNAKLIGYPDLLVGNLFASPMDIHGRFFMLTPEVAQDTTSNVDYRDRNIAVYPNALPTIDSVASIAPVNLAEFRNSPYSMTFASPMSGGNDDAPFSEAELERVLRSSDIDVNFLPDRLSSLLGGDAAIRTNGLQDIVGVSSYDVPITPRSFDRQLLEHLRKVLLVENGNVGFASLETLTPPERNLLITRYELIRSQRAFAPELFMGLKMNVNRPFGNGRDDDGNGLVDDQADTDRNANGRIDGSETYERNLDEEAFRGGTINMDLNGDGLIDQDDTNLNARLAFAKQLYCLMMLFAFPDNNHTPDHARGIAQWAVNAVDFRDSDSINTRFQYDPAPFDSNGWVPTTTVWGAERPELLITETLASHARRTEQMRGAANSPFEQRLRPEAFAFIELYNPWTQTKQQLDESLYGGSGNNRGVDLSKRSGAIASGGVTSPVWRFRIDRPNRGNLPLSLDPPKSSSTPLRYVYFTHPDHASTTDTVGDDNLPEVEVFYSDAGGAKLVPPGSQALVGTRGFPAAGNAGVYRNYFGRLDSVTSADEDPPGNLNLPTTQCIEVDENNLVVRHNNPSDVSQPANRRISTFVPITEARVGDGSAAGPRPFNVSDRFGGYPEVDNSNAAWEPIGDGYRYPDIYNSPFDQSPPRTGDHNRDQQDMAYVLGNEGTAETFRVVRLERLADPTRPWDQVENPYLVVDTLHMDLIAFNGVSGTTDPMIQNQGNPQNFTVSRASGVERGADNRLGVVPGRLLWRSERDGDRSVSEVLAGHYFGREVGRRTGAASREETLGLLNNRFLNPTVAADASKGFPWLVWNNRPFVSQMELMYVPYFGQQSANERYSVRNLTDHFSAGQFQANQLGNRSERLFSSQTNVFNHLIDFKLQALDQQGNPLAQYAPQLEVIFDYLEVPSRFVGTEHSLTPVEGAYNPFNHLPNYRVPGKVNLNTIFDQRVYQAVMGQYYSTAFNWNQFYANRNANDGFYRSYIMPTTVPPPANTQTLMRTQFNYASTNPFDDPARSVFFAHNMRQRLANLTTTRSNVYAIWVTVGFFECNADGSNVQMNQELGADEGTSKRHRGFFIFDRSIPVAYEPGRNHNIDQAILVRRLIE